LVVEDNPINQMVAEGVLGELGFSADLVANGLEALAALEATTYAAVLMDCQMPVMDGYDTTAAIRRREGAGRHTPILAMTASAVEGDRERCLASGMDDYLSKPVRPDHVRAALDRWVGGGRPDGEALAADDEGSAPGEVLDHERLDLLRDQLGGGSFLATLLAGFVAETPGQIHTLDQAVAAGDAQGVRQVGHRLRGTALNIGVPGMAAICAGLEAAAGDDMDATADLARRLQAEFDRVVTALREHGVDP